MMEIFGGSEMECIGIATAEICGLNKNPYFFDHRDYYACDIMFKNASTLGFYNLSAINAGKTYEEAQDFCNLMRKNFEYAGISDGDRVAIIFRNKEIIAIGKIGNDVWLDTTDGFNVKMFERLNIEFNSLRVY